METRLYLDTARLDELVTSAGDRRFIGIAEVLDSAVKEREERGGELAPLLAVADEQIGKLEGIERALTELRGRSGVARLPETAGFGRSPGISIMRRWVPC